MAMEIWYRECGPFRPNFTVGKTISALGKGPSQVGRVVLVAYDDGSMALNFWIPSSGLAGVMQLTLRATLHNFAFLAVVCSVA